MSSAGSQSAFRYQPFHILVAFICVLSLPTGVPVLSAQEPELIPNEKLDALVAPIALYPDPLLAQTLAASTYPLEVIQLQQWMTNNKYLKGKALADAVAKQPWDPSMPVPCRRIPSGTADGGQYSMDDRLGKRIPGPAIRRDGCSPTHACEGSGHRKSKDQRQANGTVRPSNAGKQIIEIQQANPDVVYVPSYDPTVVYGAAPAAYAYPYIFIPATCRERL